MFARSLLNAATEASVFTISTAVTKGRKTIIPDFDQQKLQGYTIRVSNKRHESSMPDSLVSEEELVLISTFLMYKKPSGFQSMTNK